MNTIRVLAFLCITLAIASPLAAQDASELLVLQNLYNGSSIWQSQDSYANISANFCSAFYGITCSAGHVVGLTIANGFPPEFTTLPDLSGLVHLTYLTIQLPQLTALPNLTAMTNITWLTIVGSELLTTKDWNMIATMTQLISLSLTNVSIGAVPQSWTGLTTLQVFTAVNAGITSLPAHFIQNMTGLMSVSISYNPSLTSFITQDPVTRHRPSGISFQGNGLTTLPDVLATFPGLTSLILDNNPLTSLPPSFSNISTLSLFSCSGCRLVADAIPAFPPSVSSINLNSNGLTSFPIGICSARATDIFINSNSLTGLDNCLQSSTCTYLDVSYNQISNSTALFYPLSGSSVVNQLHAEGNLLSDVDPSWLSSQAKTLILTNNRFTAWPTVLTQAPLTGIFVDLSNNAIAGQLADDTFSNWTAVDISIYLDYNQLTGTLPSSALTNVNMLSVRYNKLSGLGSSWGISNVINILDLSYNSFTSSSFGTNFTDGLVGPNFRRLNMAGNPISAPIPSFLTNITLANTSVSLNFSNCGLTGSLSMFDSAVTSYGYSSLDLSYNQLIGTISPGINNYLSSGAYLSLAGNQLTGPYQDLSNVGAVDFSYNQLSGTLPQAPSARFLTLSHNKLHGSIPALLSTNVATAYLDNNQFSGTLPAAAHLPLVFHVNNNQLTGNFVFQIPHSLKTDWNFANNQLNGSMVFDYSLFGPGHMVYVQNIDISNNQFSGQFPNINTITFTNLAVNGNQFLMCEDQPVLTQGIPTPISGFGNPTCNLAGNGGGIANQSACDCGARYSYIPCNLGCPVPTTPTSPVPSATPSPSPSGDASSLTATLFTLAAFALLTIIA